MEYKELTGKCISCLGCGLLYNEDFGGRLECNSYIYDNYTKKQKKMGELDEQCNRYY